MWYWFGLAALALIGEVASGGTFYLLLVALGMLGGGLVAGLGFALVWQLAACAMAALLGLLALRRTGVLKKREVNAARNVNVNLDIGQIVQVDAWTPVGAARVWYRGAHWQVSIAPGAPCKPGPHVITEIRGTRLIVTPHCMDRGYTPSAPDTAC